MLSIAPGTLSSYAAALNMFNTYCFHNSLSSTSESAINSYILHCFKSGDSCGRPTAAYSALVFWAKLENFPLNFSSLPLMSLKAFKRIYKRSRPVRWVTVEDLARLLKFWQDVQLPFWTLLILSFFTLVRPQEILNMKWSQVFFAERYIYLPWSKNDPDGEGTYVRLLPQAFDALSRLYNSYRIPPNPTSHIFHMPPTALNPWLASVCKSASVGPYTWYHLKHGGATHFALSGWTFQQIKNHGRWKSDQAARIYIHAPVTL